MYLCAHFSVHLCFNVLFISSQFWFHRKPFVPTVTDVLIFLINRFHFLNCAWVKGNFIKDYTSEKHVEYDTILRRQFVVPIDSPRLATLVVCVSASWYMLWVKWCVSCIRRLIRNPGRETKHVSRIELEFNQSNLKRNGTYTFIFVLFIWRLGKNIQTK